MNKRGLFVEVPLKTIREINRRAKATGWSKCKVVENAIESTAAHAEFYKKRRQWP